MKINFASPWRTRSGKIWKGKKNLIERIVVLLAASFYGRTITKTGSKGTQPFYLHRIFFWKKPGMDNLCRKLFPLPAAFFLLKKSSQTIRLFARTDAPKVPGKFALIKQLPPDHQQRSFVADRKPSVSRFASRGWPGCNRPSKCGLLQCRPQACSYFQCWRES